MTTELQDLLTARQTAKVLCISERKLWELTNRGEIRHVRIGRAVRYDRRDLAMWVDKHKCSQPSGGGQRS